MVLAGPLCRGDSNVVVSSFASPEYTRRKYGGEKILRESYVVMQGQYFEGSLVDGSIDKMPFDKILAFFAPELARREYWPAQTLREADLLIVVHWGTTIRMQSSDELRVRENPITDMTESQEMITRRALEELVTENPYGNAVVGLFLATHDPISDQFQHDNLDSGTEQLRSSLNHATNAQLLGYTGALRKLNSTTTIDPLEITLKSDLASDRYFVILKAYDLHEKISPGKTRRAIWTLHLNMRSPGINFRAALDRMSATAADYFGRASDGVTTIVPRLREGRVEVGTPVIVGDRKK